MPTVRQAALASVTRLYPFYSGCGTLANHRIVQKLAGAGSGIAWARVHGGMEIAAPLDDYVGRAAYYSGDLDRKVTWVCSRLVRQGDTVLDIGANLGLVTFILSTLVGPSGTVHAFEPIPDMKKMIDLAMRRNGVGNVQVHQLALGSESSDLALYVPKGHAGAASFLASHRLEDSKPIVVPVRRLSDVMAEFDVERVRLVKIDVEGFEPEVLAGAIEFFESSPPDAILFELNVPSSEAPEHPSMQLLSALGYDYFCIPKRLIRMRLFRFDRSRPDLPNMGHDFLAVRRGVLYEEVARLVGAA